METWSARAAGSRPRLFLGRAAELQTLADALAESRHGARFCLIQGEPGAGKTRLAAELGTRAEMVGHRVVWAQGWHSAGVPTFWPWTQVVRELREDETTIDLAALVAGEDPLTERFDLFDATARLLATATAAAPLVVILDDVHLVDPGSLSLLRFLLAHLDRAQLLVVGTCRPGELAERPEIVHSLETLAGLTETIVLGGLEQDDVRRLLAERDDTRFDTDEDVSEIWAVTGGNPLFVQQVARFAASEREEPPQLGRDSLLSVLSQRLAMLATESVETISTVSILGRHADVENVARTRSVSVDAVEKSVTACLDAGLLEQSAQGALRPSHPLVGEAAEASIAPTRLADLHSVATEVTEAHGASAAELSHHLLRAGPHRWADAVAQCVRAAEESASATAHETVVLHYRQAAAVLADHPDELRTRFEIAFALAGAVERAHGPAESESIYEEALELANTIGDPLLIGRAAARHDLQYYLDGRRPTRRVEECDAALAGLSEGDSALRARLTAQRAAAALAGIDVVDNRHAAAEAVAMARRVADPLALGIALTAQQVTHLGPETLSRRLRSAHEIVTLAERSAAPSLAVHGRFLLMGALLESGDIRELDAQLSAQHDHVSEVGEPRFTRHWLWFHCMRAMLDGDPERVESLAAECGQIADALQDPDGTGVYFGQLGVARWMQGRLGEMEDAYRARLREEPQEPLWPAVLAWIALHDGRLEAARAMATQFLPPSSLVQSQHTLLTLYTMADVLTAVGTDDQVRDVWEAALPYADRVVPIGMGAGCFGTISRALGGLARRLGRVPEAVTHYEQAITVAGRLGARPWLVDALLALAELLLDRADPGDQARAAALLIEARRTIEGTGVRIFDPRLAAAAERLAGPGALDDPQPETAGPSAPPRPRTTPAPRALVRIQTLGAFQVTGYDGLPATWTSRKARTLLKMLTARLGSVIGREEVMETLWPGEHPDVLGNRLGVAVSTVRRALDPERRLPAGALVLAVDDGLRLDLDHVDPAIEVDAAELVRAGNALLAGGPSQGHGSRDVVAAVLQRYQGLPFPEDPYADWAGPLRSEILATVTGLFRRLGDLAEAAGDHFAAAESARRILDLDAYDEPAHRRRVGSLHDLGAHHQSGAALEAYRSAMAELGLPAPIDPRLASDDR